MLKWILLGKVKRLDKLLPTLPGIFLKVVSVTNGMRDHISFSTSVAFVSVAN